MMRPEGSISALGRRVAKMSGAVVRLFTAPWDFSGPELQLAERKNVIDLGLEAYARGKDVDPLVVGSRSRVVGYRDARQVWDVYYLDPNRTNHRQELIAISLRISQVLDRNNPRLAREMLENLDSLAVGKYD